MRWPGSSSSDGKDGKDAAVSSSPSPSSASTNSDSSLSKIPGVSQVVAWTSSLNKPDLTDPNTWMTPAIAVGCALGFSAFYRAYLRRIPSVNHILPRYYRRRSLLGKVTSVGDGDNFHLYHTPGGRLAGWGWARKVPTYRKDLKGQTIPIRIAGVDAPEGAHFGKPAQPYSGEALDFLTQYLLGRRVRAYLYRRDQYDRVVARVLVRRWFFFRRDVGKVMLGRGLATCYEAKTGVEFGGREAQYRIAEAKAKARKRGLWSGGSGKGDVETPREYKTRMAEADKEASKASAAGATAAAVKTDTTATPSTTAAATVTPASKTATSPITGSTTTSASSTTPSSSTPPPSSSSSSSSSAPLSSAWGSSAKPSQNGKQPSSSSKGSYGALRR